MEKVTQNVPDIGCTDPDEFVNDPCIEVIEDNVHNNFNFRNYRCLLQSGKMIEPSRWEYYQ